MGEDNFWGFVARWSTESSTGEMDHSGGMFLSTRDPTDEGMEREGRDLEKAVSARNIQN